MENFLVFLGKENFSYFFQLFIKIYLKLVRLWDFEGIHDILWVLYDDWCIIYFILLHHLFDVWFALHQILIFSYLTQLSTEITRLKRNTNHQLKFFLLTNYQKTLSILIIWWMVFPSRQQNFFTPKIQNLKWKTFAINSRNLLIFFIPISWSFLKIFRRKTAIRNFPTNPFHSHFLLYNKLLIFIIKSRYYLKKGEYY